LPLVVLECGDLSPLFVLECGNSLPLFLLECGDSSPLSFSRHSDHLPVSQGDEPVAAKPKSDDQLPRSKKPLDIYGLIRTMNAVLRFKP
jgi:hypothetical protein